MFTIHQPDKTEDAVGIADHHFHVCKDQGCKHHYGLSVGLVNVLDLQQKKSVYSLDKSVCVCGTGG